MQISTSTYFQRILLLCIGLIGHVFLLQAQDSIAKKKDAAPVANPEPKKEENKDPKSVLSPPTFSGSGQPTTTPPPTQPYIVVGSYDDYANKTKKNYNYSPTFTDTVKPFIANATYLPIIEWNKGEEELTDKLANSDVSNYRPTNSKKTGVQAIAILDAWKEESRVFSVPFQLEGLDELHLSRYFDISEADKSQSPNLYLYFEGIAWRTEVKLNGKFLGLNEDAFRPWIIPLNPAWLRADDNLLELTLLNGEGKTFYPTSFLGIFRPVYILNQSQVDKMKYPATHILKHTNDTVAIFTPYYNKHRYIFDKLQAVSVLQHARKQGIQHLYFLYPPDRELRTLCKDLGFQEVEQLNPNQLVCWLNTYPYNAINFPFSEHFWLDKDGYRTEHYGSYYPYNPKEVWVNTRNVQPLYVLMLLFPLIGIFLVKLLNPNFFYALPDILIKPRLQLDRFMEVTAGNQGLAFILQLMRIVILSISLSLLIDYIHSNNQWQVLKGFNENNLVKLVFSAKNVFIGYLLKSMVLISIWTIVKYLTFRILSNLFRILHLSDGMTNIELLGAYPLLFLVPIPLIFLSFASHEWHSFILGVEITVIALYLLRQMYVCYVGMEKMFRFSFSVKVLYILVAVLLPYIICL